MGKVFKNQIVKMNMERHMVITPVCRLSFPQLFTPRAFQDLEGQPKSFQCELIFDDSDAFKEAYKGKKTQTPSMARVVTNAKIDQWGKDKDDWPKMPNRVFKIGNDRKSKDTGEVYQGYEDKVFVTVKSGEKFPPRIVGKDGKPIGENEMYGGCYVRAQLVARPYIFGKNHGVRFLLFSVMKEDDGERFGGVPNDVFDVSEADADEVFGDDETDDGDDF